MARPFTLAAVAYDAKVVTIWEGFKEFFAAQGFDFDYILFSNYETQVAAHFSGMVDAAWNSPLAWLQTLAIGKKRGLNAEAIAMRNSDCDLTSVIVVRKDSKFHQISDLRGTKIAVGAKDSPQATLIPLEMIAVAGLLPEKDYQLLYYDVLAGKHGDHIGGERDAARALAQGSADAACMIDSNFSLFGFEGTLNPSAMRVIATSEKYDHCNFTVIAERRHPQTDRFRELLLAMDYANEKIRPLLDMEGLKQWLPGRVSHYTTLQNSIDRFGTVDAFVATVARSH
jgi:phosphonate transport system substrate-binding protein